MIDRVSIKIDNLNVGVCQRPGVVFGPPVKLGIASSREKKFGESFRQTASGERHLKRQTRSRFTPVVLGGVGLDW
jgi:hypothetical protein